MPNANFKTFATLDKEKLTQVKFYDNKDVQRLSLSVTNYLCLLLADWYNYTTVLNMSKLLNPRLGQTSQIVGSPKLNSITVPLWSPPFCLCFLLLGCYNDGDIASSWSEAEEVGVGGKTSTARLAPLLPDTQYLVRILAANHLGSSPHSEPLQVSITKILSCLVWIIHESCFAFISHVTYS